VSAHANLRIALVPPVAARLRLDPQKRTADAGDGAVQLSSREFLLLEHLIRREGEVCTRAELLNSVWGFSFDTGTNVVDVYVCRLRAKLGPTTIETVRNVGYTLAARSAGAENGVNGGRLG
jgi:DNA-binding response OmpR family regulator